MKHLGDLALEQELVACVARERAAVAEVLRYLREVEARELYLARGYSSLFAYCTGKLGYSEPEAYLRIQAMRLLRAVPEVEARIERGELSLSVAAAVQGAARRERLSGAETELLVQDLAGASKREAERKLASLFPGAPRPEQARPVSEDLVEIRITVTREEAALLEELLDQTAHTNYERSYKQAFLALARQALRKKAAPFLCPDKVSGVKSSPSKGKRERPSSGKAPSPSPRKSRHIPARVRRAVWQRDQARCQYQDPLTRHKCASRHGLQLDHIQPYAQGGPHSIENLRLLCAAHNRWRSQSDHCSVKLPSHSRFRGEAALRK